MNLTFSVLTYNSADTIEKCLTSLIDASKAFDAEICLIDNASQDHTVTLVRKKYPSVRIIENKVNSYFSAHNLVINQAKGKYVAIINPDIELTKDAVAKVTDFLNKNPDIVAAVPAHVLPNGKTELVAKRRITPKDCLWVYTFFQIFNKTRKANLHKDINLPAAQGGGETIFAEVLQDSCLFARAESLKKIGGYDKNFKLYFTEDDLCLRLARFGKLVYLPQITVCHLQSTSIKKEPPFRIRAIRFLDMLTYLKKYYSVLTWLLFLPVVSVSIFAWWINNLCAEKIKKIAYRVLNTFRYHDPRDFWEKKAHAYDSDKYSSKIFPQDMWLATEIAKLKPTNILEVGCGTGRLIIYIYNMLLQQGLSPDLFGVDFSASMVNCAKSKTTDMSNIKCQVASATDLPFKENAFDCVYTHGCLMHLKSSKAVLLALKEMRRVSKHAFLIEEIMPPGKKLPHSGFSPNGLAHYWDYESFFLNSGWNVAQRKIFQNMETLGCWVLTRKL